LESEIRNLNASLNLLKDFEIEELRKKLDALMKDLRNKEDSLRKLEESNKRLIIKESNRNDELQHARKKLINVSVNFPLISSLYQLLFFGY
jgi:chromosome segregation ATPase